MYVIDKQCGWVHENQIIKTETVKVRNVERSIKTKRKKNTENGECRFLFLKTLQVEKTDLL